VNGAVTSTLEALQDAYGSRPENVQACIGPSIGPKHYQVGEEVVEAVQQRFGTTDGLIQRAEDGSAYFNLWEANRRQLEQAGVKQVEVAGICTASNTNEFFSHRAEKGKTGRFGSIIALREN
jgi:copper oxidase (laccase) domain-containing protein